MASLADKAILSGADNRPPILEKDMYDSWKSRMELYMLNRPHGKMILESVEQAIQADCDVKATNIILQGLPPEVYALVSTHKVVKDVWERIQMLMQGTSLTKQERECKLYDAFDKFAYQKGETLRIRQSLSLKEITPQLSFNHLVIPKLKYEENLIDNIYETEKNKSLVSSTPLSTTFFSTSIVQDFQDSLDYEEFTRSSHEYLNELEEEYQARALLDKSKRFFENGTQKDEEEVLSDENEAIEVKSLMAHANKERFSVVKESASNETWLNSSNKVNHYISEVIPTQKKKILGIDQLPNDTSSSGPKDLVFVKSSADHSNLSITSSNKPRLSEAIDSTLPNHDTVCSTPLPPLEKLAGAKPVSRPKTIKSILKSNSTFKAKTLKGITLKEPFSTPAKDNRKALNKLGPDLSGNDINETWYRGMIGSLMYLTASRPDIQFLSCLHARYQEILRNSTLLMSRKFLADAKYVATTGCYANTLWIKSQLTNYDILYEK
nr:hypothetical protein [Tanacetum cinerariifolium]